MPEILIFCSQNSFFDHFMALVAIFVHHRRWGCLRVLTGAHGCSRVQAGAYGCSLVGAEKNRINQENQRSVLFTL